MCYRCEVCSAKVPAGRSRKVYVIYRTRRNGSREIEREIPVCDGCENDLRTQRIEDLVVAHAFSREATYLREKEYRSEKRQREKAQLVRFRGPGIRRDKVFKTPVLKPRFVEVTHATVPTKIGVSVQRK